MLYQLSYSRVDGKSSLALEPVKKAAKKTGDSPKEAARPTLLHLRLSLPINPPTACTRNHRSCPQNRN